jgi:hypothetical protein
MHIGNNAALCPFVGGAESRYMSSLKEQIAVVECRIEQLGLQMQQQRAHIEALHREGYAVDRERGALDAMIAELALKERYRLSLLQEVAFAGERRDKAS